eukprot:COSAG01_NODE_9087_length_2561_cov_3.257920_5_plen_271_part_00
MRCAGLEVGVGWAGGWAVPSTTAGHRHSLSGSTLTDKAERGPQVVTASEELTLTLKGSMLAAAKAKGLTLWYSNLTSSNTLGVNPDEGQVLFITPPLPSSLPFFPSSPLSLVGRSSVPSFPGAAAARVQSPSLARRGLTTRHAAAALAQVFQNRGPVAVGADGSVKLSVHQEELLTVSRPLRPCVCGRVDWDFPMQRLFLSFERLRAQRPWSDYHPQDGQEGRRLQALPASQALPAALHPRLRPRERLRAARVLVRPNAAQPTDHTAPLN